jgi:hypothetical protein
MALDGTDLALAVPRVQPSPKLLFGLNIDSLRMSEALERCQLALGTRC